MNLRRFRNGITVGAALQAAAVGLLFACSLAASSALAASRLYTLDADFNLGVLDGVDESVPNQLQLSQTATTFPVLWIANSGEDTVSKFDSNLNREVARYRTWFGPAGQPGHAPHLGNAFAGAAPSRTAVDLSGNAYVLNRHFDGRQAVLLKILSNSFIDRNGNGVEDTSSDANNDGIISGAEIKNLADNNPGVNGIIDPGELQDERVAWAVRIGPANGLGRSLCLGTDGHLWVGLFNAQQYYKVSSVDGSILAGPIAVAWQPYGCIVDPNGILWSAAIDQRLLGRIDTNDLTAPFTVNSFSHASVDGSRNYVVTIGPAADGTQRIYLAMLDSSNTYLRFNPATSTFERGPAPGAPGFGAAGIAVDGGKDVIAGRFGGGGINKYDEAGALSCSGATQSNVETRGVVVDSQGNYWQVNKNANSLSKYSSGCAPLGVFPVGDQPYTYSDASGFAARNITSPTGTWTITQDGGINGAKWGRVSWTESLPTGASIDVRVRSSNSQASLPGLPFMPVTNGGTFTATGRFLQVESRLNANTQRQSPILFDLSIASQTCDVDGNGAIDRRDIALIMAARNQPSSGFADQRDDDGDGRITVNDASRCQLKCTLPNCAVSSTQ